MSDVTSNSSVVYCSWCWNTPTFRFDDAIHLCPFCFCVHKILHTTQNIFNRSFIITQIIGHCCQRRYFLPTTYMHVIWCDVLIFMCKIKIAIFLWICFHILVFAHYNKQIAYLLYCYVHSQCRNNKKVDIKCSAHCAFQE